MFNVTWRPEEVPVDRIFFFLGSSTAGDGWPMGEEGAAPKTRKIFFFFLGTSLQMKLFEQNTFDGASSLDN